MKTLNFRALKIISVYLHSPIFRTVLDRYLNQFTGLGTLKYFKEFFNISMTSPITEAGRLIVTSKIIDGKIDGKIQIDPVTVNTSTYFHIENNLKDLLE
jgi:hypothetical protein